MEREELKKQMTDQEQLKKMENTLEALKEDINELRNEIEYNEEESRKHKEILR